MRTKEHDIPYCGVRKKVIDKAEPELDMFALKLFNEFIKERYNIHLKKDVLHKKPPYTDNKILREYRFTNIRREHDRETIWLLDNIVNNEFLTYRQKLLNCILFRLFNKHETMEIIGGPIKFEGVFNPIPARNKLYTYYKNHPKYVFFTGAFITGGLKRVLNMKYPNETFVPGCVIRFMKHLNESGIMDKIQAATTQEEVFNLLRDEEGIGEFLAYQIFVDFSYIKQFPFSENEYTVAGPGCKKGLKYLFKDTDGMTPEECLFWLRDNWCAVGELLEEDCWFDPKEEMIDLKHYDRVMNVMSLENCFCEFSKYYRAYTDTGRPRKKYKPRQR